MLSEQQLNFLEEQAKSDVNYSKNAFNCSKCPKKNGTNGCPAWWDFKWHLYNEQLKAHSEKRIEGCSFILQPVFLADLVTTVYNGIDNNRQLTKSVKQIASNLDDYTKVVQIDVRAGFNAVLKLLGTKDLQRILIENEDLRNKLNERQAKEIEANV